MDFVGAKGDGGAGNNWSSKTCKAPVKSSPPTNLTPNFYRPDAILVVQQTVLKHRTVQIYKNSIRIISYPRRARSAIGVDTVFTLDVCLYVCMYVSALERKRLIGMT